MADRGIIFSAPMVRALLDGRKTQTRRGLIPPLPFDFDDDISVEVATGSISPPYATGDRLYVREAWRFCSQMDGLKPSEMSQHEPRKYEADGALHEPACMMIQPGRYRHARFMPRWASRLTLIVTEVRVQRLQEISEADAVAEGVGRDHVAQLDSGDLTGVTAVFNGTLCADHRDAMRETWAELHGAGAWAANPWVAAITFTVHRCNIDQMPGG